MLLDEKKFKEFILDSGLVSAADLEAAEKDAADKGISLSQALLSKGKLSDNDLRHIQAYILGVPFVDLKNLKIDFDVLSIIPEPIARNHNILAFKKTEDILEVAMLDLEDLVDD